MARKLCKVCGKPGEKQYTSKKGVSYFRAYCTTCYKQKQKYGTSYNLFKKDKCELCGFNPINSCQLDVDHIDGNKFNNDPQNLQTLCANCHRLKTFFKQGLG